MKRNLSDDFLKTLAYIRAKELFTKEFLKICTDAWYGDEFVRFKEEATCDGKLLKPSDDDAYRYMGWLQEYKYIYQDNYYTLENALMQYEGIINKLHYVLDEIDEGQKRYKGFECDSEIVTKLRDVGNYFVNKYNKDYETYKKNKKNHKKKHGDVA